MAIVKWKNRDLDYPWEGFRSLQDEINELFNIDRSPASAGLFDRNLSPAIDLVEGDQNFVIRCELPGLDQNDLDVSVVSNVLTIKGEKKERNKEKTTAYFKKECWSGKFQRTISLPNSADTEKISAELKEGILNIVLQKKEEAKQKQISVKIS